MIPPVHTKDRQADFPPLPPLPAVPRRADATRERLLQATHELLHERQGSHVSVSDICERAATNVAMVRYCFGSKDGLMLALMTRITDSFRVDFQSLAGTPLPWREKLADHLREVVRNYMRFPYITRLLSDQLRNADAKSTRALSESIVVPMAAFHQQLLAEGVRAGEVREVDPVFFFFSTIGMCEFLFAARPWLTHGFGESLDDDLVERYAKHVVQMVLSGVSL